MNSIHRNLSVWGDWQRDSPGAGAMSVSARLEAAVGTDKGNAADLVSTNGTYLAYTAGAGELVVNVVSVKSPTALPLRLLISETILPGSGHSRRGVTAVHIGTLPAHRGYDVLVEKRLFAATRRRIYSWDIEDCYAAQERGATTECRALDIPTSCLVSHLQTDGSLKWLAAASDSDVLVYDLHDECLVMRLECHSLQVNAMHFDARQASDHLITVSDDRTFKVWNLQRRELVYQSSIYGASPLTCLAVDPSFPRMAVGSIDGLVRFFDLCSPSFQLIQSLDLPLAVKRKFGDPVDQDQGLLEPQVHVISGRTGGGGGGADSVGGWKQDAIGMGCISSVSALYYIKTESKSEDDLLPISPKVIACTTQMLVMIDAYTYDILSIVPFSEYSYRNCLHLDIDTPRLFAADNRSSGVVTVCVGSAFTPVINVVRVAQEEEERGCEGAGAGGEGVAGIDSEASAEEKISVFPTSPPRRLSSSTRPWTRRTRAMGPCPLTRAPRGESLSTKLRNSTTSL